MASSSGTRLQAGLSCGSTRRILTLFRFFHHLHDTTRHFAKGRGLRGKTDSIDADLLALYAERERPEPRPPADAETAALQALVMRR
jgi:transposase